MNSKYKIFLELCEDGSFSKTAEKLGYSQSAVSQAVKSLEEELGTVLLERKREGLRLTHDGNAYMPYFRNIVAAEESLEKKKREMGGLVDEIVRIGTFTSVSRNVLPKLLADFRKMYPHVQFELRQGEYDNIYQWLQSGEVDFAFMNPNGYAGIHTDIIYHDTMVAVLPKGHPLCRKKKVSLRDLCDDAFILLDEGQHSVPLDAFAQAGLCPNVTYKVYDDYSILAMVRQKMGISILYRLVVMGFEKDVEIRPIEEPIERTIAIACMNPHVMSRASKILREYILKQVPSLVEQWEIESK